ncbi:MAG: hypothetical protein AB7I04_01995 [Pseudomonadales bacterium]
MNRREAQELLPWFVAGTLSDEETRAVQAFIDSGAISADELHELTLFAETVAERAPDEPAYDPAILQRAMSRLDGITQEAPEPPLVVGEVGRDAGARGQAQSDDGRPGLIQRVLDALQWSSTPTLARVVVAGQFALLLGLAVMVGSRSEEAVDAGGFETVAGETPVLAADFSLSFAPGISEADARALLIGHRLNIVAGPSALGIYQVSAPEGADLERIAAELSVSPLVILLERVPQP